MQALFQELIRLLGRPCTPAFEYVQMQPTAYVQVCQKLFAPSEHICYDTNS